MSAQPEEEDFHRVPIEVAGDQADWITTIAIDKEGFLWTRGVSGLIRYDGYESKGYSFDPADSTSVHTDGVEVLFTDVMGDVWVGGLDGLSRYHPGCDCFFRYIDKPDQLAPTGSISDITEDSEHNLWITARDGGLFRYNLLMGQFEQFLGDESDPNSVKSNALNVVLADRQNRLWIGTSYASIGNKYTPGGLIRFTPKTGEVKRFFHDPSDPQSLVDDRISALLEDNEGRILVGTYQSGLHLYVEETEAFVRLQNDEHNPIGIYAPIGKGKFWNGDPFVKVLHQDQKGGYWVGTCGTALNYFDPEAKFKRSYIHDSNRPNVLSNNIFWSIEEDLQGHIWLGTLSQTEEGALHMLDLYAPELMIVPASQDFSIMPLAESKVYPGSIWVGGFYQGLSLLDEMAWEGSFYHPIKGDPNSLGSDHVRAVCEDRFGDLWIGLGWGYPPAGPAEIGDGGLDRLDYQTGIFSHYTIKRNDSTKLSHTVYDLCEDQEGRLWIGLGEGGLFYYDRVQKTFVNYPVTPPTTKAGGAEVYMIHEDALGTLWVGDFANEGTLYRYDRDEDRFINVIAGYKPTAILNDGLDNYWIGTRAQGLVYFNLQNQSLKQYTRKQGVPGMLVAAILRDDDGLIWIATDRGMAKLAPLRETFISDNLPRLPHFGPSMKSNSGQLIFNSRRGLVSFYPEQMEGNPFPPNITLRDMKVSGKSYAAENQEITKESRIILNHSQHDISFDFAGVHFSIPGKNKHQFKLTPYDSDWIDAGRERSARYTNLKPGSYAFQVKAANAYGVWTNAQTLMSFKITPPWWQTWWAYTLFAFAFASGIRAIILYRSRLLKQENIKLEDKVAERTRTLEKQSDELHQKSSDLELSIQNLKNTQNQLIQSEKLASLGELTAGIAHEIQNPLNFVNNFSEVSAELVDEMKDEINNGNTDEVNLITSDLKMNLSKILEHGKRADSIVKNMLQHSKMSTGQKEPTDINALAKEYLGLAYHGLRAKDKTFTAIIETDFDKSVGEVNVIAQDIGRVLLNLFSNAFYAVHQKNAKNSNGYAPTVSLVTKKMNDEILISIRDNGVGIPTSMIEKIFQPFFSTKPTGEGTGLGLSLAHDIITKSHSGQLEVESVLGEATEFKVTIPV